MSSFNGLKIFLFISLCSLCYTAPGLDEDFEAEEEAVFWTTSTHNLNSLNRRNLNKVFNMAVEKAKGLPDALPTPTQNELYALRNQGKKGNRSLLKRAFGSTSAENVAWDGKRGMDRREAKRAYISLVNDLIVEQNRQS